MVHNSNWELERELHHVFLCESPPPTGGGQSEVINLKPNITCTVFLLMALYLVNGVSRVTAEQF